MRMSEEGIPDRQMESPSVSQPKDRNTKPKSLSTLEVVMDVIALRKVAKDL